MSLKNAAPFVNENKFEVNEINELNYTKFHNDLDNELARKEDIMKSELKNEYDLLLKKNIQEHEFKLKKKKMDLELEIQKKMKEALS